MHVLLLEPTLSKIANGLVFTLMKMLAPKVNNYILQRGHLIIKLIYGLKMQLSTVFSHLSTHFEPNRCAHLVGRCILYSYHFLDPLIRQL